MLLKTVILTSLLSLFSCLVSASQLALDNSATYRHASDQAKARWPEGSFKPFFQKSHHVVGEIAIPDLDKKRPINIDLSNLKPTKEIILLIHDAQKNRGIADFLSSESGSYSGPQLALTIGEKQHLLAAELDTYIIAKNRKPMGGKKILKVGGDHVAILVFTLSESLAEHKINNATLMLNITNRQYGPSTLNISQLLYTPKEAVVETQGIANKYPGDQGIAQHPDVFYADNFDQQSWLSKLKIKAGISEPVWDNTQQQHFTPHEEIHHFSKTPGQSVMLPFRTNSNLAGNLDYYFKKHAGYEPEEAYFRYYSMLDGNAWVSGGGKLPGFGGTYNRAGWGGRANNGENGWSARGAFFKTIPNSNPHLGGRMPIGSYLYEADTRKKYGETFAWGDPRSAMQPGKWYCIEQHLKLNTPGKSDGLLEVWIDGVSIYKRSDLNFRSTDELKIEKIWMNYYFGGVAKPEKAFNMYLDNVVIASSYIGPMRPAR